MGSQVESLQSHKMQEVDFMAMDLIERTRKKMYEAYLLFGILDKRTLALSVELDELMNKQSKK